MVIFTRTILSELFEKVQMQIKNLRIKSKKYGIHIYKKIISNKILKRIIF
jgi:hypothetical protein